MKRTTVIAAGVLFGVIFAGAATVYVLRKRADAAAASAKVAHEPMESIEVVPATLVPWQPLSELTGTVISLRSVRVQNEVEGVVRSVHFQSGDVVEAGQVLAVLDDSTDRANLAAAEASVRVKEADLKVVDARIALARADFARQNEAIKVSATSATELDRARAELDKAEADRARVLAEIDEAAARVEQIKVRLAKFTIRAPFKGRVGMRTVHEGQFMPPQMGMGGDSSAVAVIEEVTANAYLDFAVPQEQMSRVQVGTTVVGTAPLLGDRPVTLKVVASDASANTQTRNVRVRTELANPDGLLRPGMSIRVRVPIEDMVQVVAVPSTSVRRASFGDAVFVVTDGPDGSKVARQRFVRLGPVVGGQGPAAATAQGVQPSPWIAVLEGLTPGETVASVGSFKLFDGVKVMVVSPGAPQGQATRN